MAGTPGQKKISETLISPNRFISITPNIDLSQVTEPQVIFEKQSLDVFSNPNFVPFLQQQGWQDYYVFGVATDYCVLAAVLGLLKRGYRVKLITDAIAGVSPENSQKALAEMQKAGAEMVCTNEVIT